MRRCRVQFVASEIFPLAKSGGLADVCASLPASLASLGADIRLVMPAYDQALAAAHKPRPAGSLRSVMGYEDVRLVSAHTPDSGLPITLIDIPELFREGGLYQTSDGSDRPDNAVRFAALSDAASQLARPADRAAWRPDVVHCHDWHTGLLPLMMDRRHGTDRPASVFTVHNIAFQGQFPWHEFASLGLDLDDDAHRGVEFYGKASYLKAGLSFADWLTTVSPTYAREIRTPDHGCGMDGVVCARAERISGILNGIDTDFWNPATSPWLAANYSIREVQAKRACKRDLQSTLGLDRDDAAPLLVFVARLTTQKMADVLLDALPRLLAKYPDCQFALLGQGDKQLEEGFRQFASLNPRRISVEIGYGEDRAQRLLAGGDILVHGSRFEPCGLTQQHAMRFGTIPVVSRVGGLADTVIDATAEALANRTANGVCLDEPSLEAMLAGIDAAIALYRQPLTWRRMQLTAMSGDFGWERSARQYLDIYDRLVPEREDVIEDRVA